jgi:hypothetical protein
MPIFGFLPGASEQDMIDREVADLNPTRTGSADRTGSWNWQDGFGAWLAGTNRDRVIQGAADKENRRLQQLYSGRAQTNSETLGSLAPRYTGNPEGLTVQEIEARIAQDELRGETFVAASANPNFDGSTLDPNSGVTAITAAVSAGNQAKDDKDKADRNTETRRQEGRQLSAERRQSQRELGIESRARDQRNHELSLSRLDSREARLRAAESDQLTLQLEYARLGQRDRERRADRKDKSMMMLLQGLGNLGAGFTI